MPSHGLSPNPRPPSIYRSNRNKSLFTERLQNDLNRSITTQIIDECESTYPPKWNFRNYYNITGIPKIPTKKPKNQKKKDPPKTLNRNPTESDTEIEYKTFLKKVKINESVLKSILNGKNNIKHQEILDELKCERGLRDNKDFCK
jgi:hypothetical protein